MADSNTIYMDYQKATVEDWLSSISESSFVDHVSFDFNTGKEWREIIHSVRQDETLMNMRVVTTHIDNASGGGGGVSTIFVSDSTGDAVIAFKGTESNEWADNFIGGNVSDTRQQENALEWYRQAYDQYGLDQYEVTVTGHSKGGNKSKYITIRDETVDHCVSFDGQGFSDKFIRDYETEIAQRQAKIHNHNIDYDYVNILLNDVGETTYYRAYNIGEGGFLENHCPNTFFHFAEDGSFSMEERPGGQPASMQSVDEFLNSLLRSMPDEQRTSMLNTVNEFVVEGLELQGRSSEETLRAFLRIATNSENATNTAYLVAYLLKYEQQNPDFGQHIKEVLEEFGMGECSKYISIADSLLNLDIEIPFIGYHITFDTVLDAVNGMAVVLEKVLSLLEKSFGIHLTSDDLKSLVSIMSIVNADMDRIRIPKDRKDRKVSVDGWINGSGDSCGFEVFLQELIRAGGSFEFIRGELHQISERLKEENCHIEIKSNITETLNIVLFAMTKQVEHFEHAALLLHDMVQESARKYQNNETTLFLSK